MSDNWYLDDGFWSNFGPLMFNEDTFAQGRDEVQQLLERVDLESGHVLDLGCGPGRHALPLARAGLQVTAVDTSDVLLDQLRQAKDDLDIDIVQADMRSFARDGAFDLVIVMWTSFGYFDDEADHRKVLDNIKRSLAPSGQLVLDLVGLEYLCRHLQPVHLTEFDDGRILVERPVLTDDLTRLENEWLLIEGDRVQRHTFSHRVWSAGEICALLARTGFVVRAVHGSFSNSDYNLDSERLILIAQPDRD